MESKICLVCGKEFFRNGRGDKSWSSAKYCCRECMGTANTKKIKHKCDYCGKEYDMCLYKLKNNNNYCSNDCKILSKQVGCGITTDGYVWILIGRKQIKLHRYLMEIKMGRKLLSSEIVHHIDGNKLNNSIDNLMIVTRTQHNKIHKFLEGHK